MSRQPPQPVDASRIEVRTMPAGEALYVDGARYWDGPALRRPEVVRALRARGHYYGASAPHAPEKPADDPPARSDGASRPEPRPEARRAVDGERARTRTSRPVSGPAGRRSEDAPPFDEDGQADLLTLTRERTG